MTSHDYTTCIDGKGYRFILPSLGLPDPQGEWVTIQAALTTNQLDTLDALNKVRGNTEGALRSPSEDRVTIDVLHEGATWLLPILQPEGREETQAFTLRVRRLPARGGEDATAQNEELLARAAASISLNDLSSGDSSSSESSASHPPSTSRELPVAPTIDPARALNSRPSGSVVSDTEVLGPLSLSFRYKDHFDWSFHFDPTILHLEYLDVLPQGDPIPPKLVPYHREAGANWSVDFTQRILYHRPAVPPGLRNKHWQALLSSTGLECDIGRGMMTINLGLQRHNYVKLPLPQQLSNGAARLKVIPNPPNYACQPSAASAEASYFLNRYQLFIEQNGKTVSALNPSAAYLPFNEEILLCLLGQAASASAPDSTTARMVFEQHPPKLEGVAELLNVGVRLRDGGSRYHIIMREQGQAKGEA